MRAVPATGRRPGRAAAAAALLLTLLVGLGGPADAAAVLAPAVGTTTAPPIASAVPAAYTPWVRDGQVLGIAQVGDAVVLGGTFTAVSPPGVDAPVVARSGAVAVDAATGEVLAGFAPALVGPVNAVLAGPTPGTVYVAGDLTTVNGVRTSVALLELSTGALVAGWRPVVLNAPVADLALAGGRLVVAGTFSRAGPFAASGLSSFSATTGAFDPWLDVPLAQNHNWTAGSTGARARVGAQGLTVSPDGRTMAVIGNFRKAGGLLRDQMALLDLTGTAPVVRADWATSRFAPACTAATYDSWVRDVAVSPDGAYVVVATTGGPWAGTLCDGASRWDLAATGTDVAPVWTMATGGDTLFAATVTAGAVYVGGHNRWANNPSGGDSAAAGAVPRPGIVALDPDSGVPLSWNPGRNPRGIGTTALLATATGLWVGSDTEYIGNFQLKRWRVALFPFAGGTTAVGDGRWDLPGNVFQAGPAAGTDATALLRHYRDGTTVQRTQPVVGTGLDGSTVRGAFVVDGTLWYGASDGLLHRRPFDGTTAGPAQTVDPYLDPYWSTVKTGTGTGVYRGVRPTLYGAELKAVTGLTYAADRVFYTLPGADAGTLFWRWFSPDSGVVGAQLNALPGSALPADLQGMFAADGYLWYASGSTGDLTRRRLDGVVLDPTAEVVGGPAVDGVDWRARALFAGPGPGPVANTAPTAALTVSCTRLTCAFDGTGSTDADGRVVRWAWRFGKAGAATGPRPSYVFPAGGTYPVTLTVTDDSGATASTSRTVTVTKGGTVPSSIAARGSSTAQGNATTTPVALPPGVAAGDALLLLVSVGATTTQPAAPAGWTEVGRQVWGTAQSVVWSRVATDAEPTTVLVTQSATAKIDVQLAAWSGTAADPVAAIAGSTDVASAAHTTPSLVAADAGSWVVSSWTDKSSTTTGWTPPAGVVVRGTTSGAGTGYLTSLLADGGAGVPAGTAVGGLTATTAQPSSRGSSWTVVLRPAASAPQGPAATAPVGWSR